MLADFNTSFFPQQILLLAVGDNVMPMGYWMVISKDPFRFLICLEVSNYSLELIREKKEAVLHFMPWSERERVVRAGYLSGRDTDKNEVLGFERIPAEKLEHTKLVAGAECVYETVVNRELEELSGEFSMFVLDVVATHGKTAPRKRNPILYLSLKDFGTLGERWKFSK